MKHYGGMNYRLIEEARGKKRIKSLDRMVANMKAKFIPQDYWINLFKRLTEPETEMNDSKRVHRGFL
jgi:hypothetical protein